MRRALPSFLVFCLAPGLLAGLSSRPALAQPIGGGLTPLALDLKKVPVGSWAEYTVTVGGDSTMTMKSRWALVARDANGSTLETSVEGGPVAMMGGKMVMKVALVPDPLTSEKPIKQAVVQVGDRDPMEMPLNMPNMPAQRFQKPDPKKLVGKEQVTVAGGSFKASHYHDVTDRGVIDLWVADGVGPLGMVKMSAKPSGNAKAENQPPPITMELTAKGKDAKPAITKSAKPFDPAEFGGPGAPPPGHAPAPAPAGKAPPVKAPAPKP
jgi:hypothetical protein